MVQLLSRNEIMTRKPLDWLIPGVVPSRELTMVYGASGSGKTFFAIHLAACVATGLPFNGVSFPSGRVVYIAGEGDSEFTGRLQAWEARHQRELPDDLFYLVPGPVQLGNLHSVDNFLQALDEKEVVPDLIVIDTLSSCALGVDEKDNAEMRDLLQRGADRIRRATPATVLLIHHTGKVPPMSGKNAASRRQSAENQATARGAQTLKDSVAMQALLTGDGQTRMTLTCTKLKDGRPFDPITLTLREMMLPDGRTSLAAACTVDGTIAEPAQQAKATTKQGTAYKTGSRKRARRLTQAEVLHVVQQAGIAGIGPTEVAKALGVDPRGSSVKNLMRKLREGGQVRRVGDGNTVKYVATSTDTTDAA